MTNQSNNNGESSAERNENVRLALLVVASSMLPLRELPADKAAPILRAIAKAIQKEFVGLHPILDQAVAECLLTVQHLERRAAEKYTIRGFGRS